jgi:arginyl-tRNA synthetase
MLIESQLQPIILQIVEELYGAKPEAVEFQQTRKEFEGDITLVVFPLLRVSRKGPEQTANEIGEALVLKSELVSKFNAVKGFLNITIDQKFWLSELKSIITNQNFGFTEVDKTKPCVLVEYSSPNTNKPLHLGHVRNNLLGFSISRIIEATGKDVKKVQIINDRGIHICKSMLAWQLFGNGETPESSGHKGDHLVGKYYVAFDKAYKLEMAELQAAGASVEEAAKNAPLIIAAQEMLQKWEAGDAEVVDLWKTMNAWVYEGFQTTYDALGVSFDKNYYESETYILGKSNIEKGLADGVFYKREDGSVWIDLTEDGLDEKLVLRSDGTSVYMTQDIGTAIARFEEFNADGLTYVVGSEQEYHFKVLFLILQKLGYSWANHLHHLSYGMVDLPTGKMKSREGTVVDADDLIDQMITTATETSEELGKLDGYDDEYKNSLNRMIGLAALKYYILKVDPKRRMLFNPAESIDFNGNTGPFIQYAYARIQSLKRKAGDLPAVDWAALKPEQAELDLIQVMTQFPTVIAEAAANFSPAQIANYAYDLVKTFNSYYQKHSILASGDENTNAFRLELSSQMANIVQRAMYLLGIDCPERM